MAKRHHRSYRLGGMPLIGQQVSMGAVYGGGIAALFGTALFNYINNNFINTPAPAGSTAAPTTGFIDSTFGASTSLSWVKPLFGPAIAAVILYFGVSKGAKKPALAAGLATGAIGFGLASAAKGALTQYLTPMVPALSFAGAPIRVVPSLQPGTGYTTARFPGLSRRFGEVVVAPSTRRGFGMVVNGPGFKRAPYADHHALSGIPLAHSLSRSGNMNVMDSEMAPV